MSNYYVTANRLHDGASVWLTNDNIWADTIDTAARFEGEARKATLEGVGNDDAEQAVVDVRAVPVALPFREQIRAHGPSVRADLGTQAARPARLVDLPPPPSQAGSSRYAGIYRYDDYDRQYLRDRAAQFRKQVARRLSDELSEDEFKPLRLMNGLYLQLHGYMLRAALPYGVMSAAQLRQLAYIARHFDRGYGHFTTRQNIQYNWIRLEDAADILAILAEADLHAIQTSGNCVRNVTTDHFAGAAVEEVVDPRVFAEILRQWSTDHPEFTYLPRKFKIAITGGPVDRAAIRFHDIGILAKRNEAGEPGFSIYAGGGLGRTPLVGVQVREWLPVEDLLRYVEAILRTYNALGRRDNIYKARIKILIKEMRPESFIAMIENEFAALPADYNRLDPTIVSALQARFVAPPFKNLPVNSTAFEEARNSNPAFSAWADTNSYPHQMPGYVSATVSLKSPGGIPGDATAEEMEAVADLADLYSFGEIRVSHEQNLVLPHVRKDDLHALWSRLVEAGLASGNIGLITDIIACPGLDYCSLATSRSIPIAQRIAERFADPDRQREIGPIDLNVSGCINACGHHHVAQIGLLGVDKAGEEFYQITLGGASDEQASIGSIIGPAVASENVVDTIDAILDAYVALRLSGEKFADTYRRLGSSPFKEAAYARD